MEKFVRCAGFVKLKFHDHLRGVVSITGGMIGKLSCSTECRSPHLFQMFALLWVFVRMLGM